MNMLNTKKNKTGTRLKSCLGLLKKDKEAKSIKETLKKGWKKFSNKYQ